MRGGISIPAPEIADGTLEKGKSCKIIYRALFSGNVSPSSSKVLEI
jgi:hypothetical protein